MTDDSIGGSADIFGFDVLHNLFGNCIETLEGRQQVYNKTLEQFGEFSGLIDFFENCYDGCDKCIVIISITLGGIEYCLQ